MTPSSNNSQQDKKQKGGQPDSVHVGGLYSVGARVVQLFPRIANKKETENKQKQKKNKEGIKQQNKKQKQKT